jgi:uncharacterized protein
LPTIGTLSIRSRRPGLSWEQPDDRIVIAGELQWVIEGAADAVRAAASTLAGLSEELAPGLLLVDFGNAVGRFQVPGLGTLEVVSSKWDRKDFDAMLADLMDVASALPFAAGDAAALPYDRSVTARVDVLYHTFAYVRYILLSEVAPAHDRLLPSLDLIMREPHALFRRIAVDVHTELASKVDAASLVQIVAGGQELTPVRGTAAASSPLGHALRGHLPERVREAQVQSTRDTAENRFVKAFLHLMFGIIEGMRRVVRGLPMQTAFSRRLLDDCDAMDRALAPIVRNRFWQEVGPMVHLPAASTVLQRRRGYREVYRHHVKLRLASRVPLPDELVQDLLEAKDIAQLYELWCYFALARSITQLLGKPTRAGRPRVTPTELSVPWDLEIAWPGNVRLLYNPSFSRSRPEARRSYSVPLRPDIALDVPSGPSAGLHLLDAKFRLTSLETIMSENSNEDEVVEERRGTFKRADLYKMHTYRDAIPRARSVWILYPGTDFQFFSSGGNVARSAFDTLPRAFDGVGAVPLLPSIHDQPQLESMLESLIGREVAA